MITLLESRVAGRNGVTLVEVMATVFIMGIAITGLAIAYSEGISHWRRASEKMVLYNEGSQALYKIEKAVRRCGFMTTSPYGGYPDAYMQLRVPVGNGLGDISARVVEYYFYPPDKSIRVNDLTGDYGEFNGQLLPIMHPHSRQGQKPYLTVKSVRFRMVDPERPDNPTPDGYGLVRVELVLEAPLGDTLYLSSVMAKRNTNAVVEQ
jgi:prepilin-type N-terminal cleavage/methylation domain-containing protein